MEYKTIKLLGKKIELTYDPAIAVLSIYPKDTNIVIWKGTSTPTFKAAMTTIAKLQKSLMPIDRWMDKEDAVCINTMEYYSAILKNEILPFAIT